MVSKRLTDTEPGHDRRRKARYALRCRVVFFRELSNPIAQAVTQNVSSIGFYCISSILLQVGDFLNCLLKIPTDVAEKDASITLNCLVRVVRTENTGEGLYGIACEIESYHTHVEIEASGPKAHRA